MKIYVKSLTGDDFSLNIKETDTVQTLKSQINKQLGY